MLMPKITVDKGMLTITLPLKTALAGRQLSGSGKSLLLTSVSERVDVPDIGMIRVGLNVFQKNPGYAEHIAQLESTAKK